jgi:hypothetical protein
MTLDLFRKEIEFNNIHGYDDIKDIVRRALDTEYNYNLIFVGPPASAKTLFLLGILARTAVLHRITPELGICEAEVAKVFYRERLEESYLTGCFIARNLIERFNRGLKKMKVEFHAAKVTVPGRGEKWLYYNMHSLDKPEEVTVIT